MPPRVLSAQGKIWFWKGFGFYENHFPSTVASAMNRDRRLGYRESFGEEFDQCLVCLALDGLRPQMHPEALFFDCNGRLFASGEDRDLKAKLHR